MYYGIPLPAFTVLSRTICICVFIVRSYWLLYIVVVSVTVMVLSHPIPVIHEWCVEADCM